MRGNAALSVQSGQENFLVPRLIQAIIYSRKRQKVLPGCLLSVFVSVRRRILGAKSLERWMIVGSRNIGIKNSGPKFLLKFPIPDSSIQVSVDEWKTILLGGADY